MTNRAIIFHLLAHFPKRVKARAGTDQSQKLGVWPVVSHMDAKSQGLGSLLNAFPGALVGSWMGDGASEMS